MGGRCCPDSWRKAQCAYRQGWLRHAVVEAKLGARRRASEAPESGVANLVMTATSCAEIGSGISLVVLFLMRITTMVVEWVDCGDC